MRHKVMVELRMFGYMIGDMPFRNVGSNHDSVINQYDGRVQRIFLVYP